MTSGIPATPSASPIHAGASGNVRARGALRPLALGLTLSALGTAAMILGAYAGVLRLNSFMLSVACALPVLCTLPLVWGRSTSLEITPEGFELRRRLAPSRWYPASAVVIWGFQNPTSLLNTIPPPVGGLLGHTSFVLETTDGRRFETRVTVAEADRIVTLLLQHQTGFACDRRRGDL